MIKEEIILKVFAFIFYVLIFWCMPLEEGGLANVAAIHVLVGVIWFLAWFLSEHTSY